MCLMGRKQLSHGIQTGKNNGKPKIDVKKSRQRMHMHLLVSGQHMSRPMGRTVKSTGRPTYFRAGPSRPRVSWVSLPCHGPRRAVNL